MNDIHHTVNVDLDHFEPFLKTPMKDTHPEWFLLIAVSLLRFLSYVPLIMASLTVSGINEAKERSETERLREWFPLLARW